MSQSKRVIGILATLLALASLVVACAAPVAAPAAAPAGDAAATGDKIKVGLSFSDFATERWKNEEVLIRGLLEEKGYEVLSTEANQDVKLQNDQIDNMVSQGVKALIIVERDTQKGIIIGHQGQALKKVGAMARKDIERFFGKKVFLEMFVKVEKDWRNRDNILKNFGYQLD